MNPDQVIMLLLYNAIVSKESLRFRYTKEQGFDTSCGMSVVATALDLYWGIPVEELELLPTVGSGTAAEGMYTVSLADMASAFESRNIAARAFKLDWNGLRTLTEKGYSPVVVHYSSPERHFALLLGFREDQAITVDPARGLEILSRPVFEKRYSGAAMALASRIHTADMVLVSDAIDAASGRMSRMEEAAVRDSFRAVPTW